MVEHAVTRHALGILTPASAAFALSGRKYVSYLLKTEVRSLYALEKAYAAVSIWTAL